MEYEIIAREMDRTKLIQSFFVSVLDSLFAKVMFPDRLLSAC